MTKLLATFLLLTAAAFGQGTSLTLNTWQAITPGGYTTYKIVGWENAYYVPALSAVCVHGSLRNISSEPNQTDACWNSEYNFTYIVNNGSTFHDMYMPEGGHPVQGTQIDPATNIRYHYGNFSGAQVSEKPQIAGYLFDFLGLAGRQLHPLNKPNYNTNLASGTLDYTNHKLMQFGGTSFAGWNRYNPATNTWDTGILCTSSSSNCPNPSALEGSAVFRPATGKVYQFGGDVTVGGPADLFLYNAATNTSTKLAPSGTKPNGRVKAVMVWDTVNDVLILHGGSSTYPTQTMITDTNVYDPNPAHCGGTTDGCWIQPALNDPSTPVSPTFWRGAFDPGLNALVIWNAGPSTYQMWVYRYAGTGPNIGRTTAPTYTETSGAINLNATTGTNVDSWAERPSVTVDNSVSPSRVYATWSETGLPAVVGACGWQKNTVSTTDNGTWAQVGTDCNSTFPDAWFSYNDGVTNGTTTFTSATATFSSGCNGGSCAGQQITIGGLGIFTIVSVSGGATAILDRAAAAGTALNYVVLWDGAALSVPSISFQENDGTITMVGGVPWVCGHFGSNHSFLDIGACFGYTVGTGKWDQGGIIGVQTPGVTCPAPSLACYTQGHMKVTDVGGVPFIALQEVIPETTVPYRLYAYVAKWDAGTQSFVNVGGALNRLGNTTNITKADSVSIVSNGSQPCAAHTEYTTTIGSNLTTDTASQVYVDCLVSGSWSHVGSSANVNTANIADWVDMTYMGGQIYLAFVERTVTGPEKLYVRKWNGSAYATVGSGPLNRDATTGWVFRPEIATDGTDIWVAWDEQQALGQKPQIHVSQFHAGTGLWENLGTSLNKDAANSAAHPSLAIITDMTLPSRPVVVWSELKLGVLQKVYTAEWNGADWSGINAPFGTAPTITSTSPLHKGYFAASYSRAVAASGRRPITGLSTAARCPRGSR
jgi:hypothetical protein